MDRKEFFRDGLKEIVKGLYNTPIGNFIDTKLQSVINVLEPFAYYSTEQKTSKAESKEIEQLQFLRPPGAQEPNSFLEFCNSCGDCVIACPHSAIFCIPEIEGPIIDVNFRPCYLCKDYPCIQACETKALLSLHSEELPYFGKAIVRKEKCLNYPLVNTKKRKLNCTRCLENCPVEDAISLKNKVPEILNNCVGCGVCKKQCPENAIEIQIH